MILRTKSYFELFFNRTLVEKGHGKGSSRTERVIFAA